MARIIKLLFGVGVCILLISSCGEEEVKGAKDVEAQETLEQIKKRNLESLNSFDGTDGRPSGIIPPKD